MSAESLVHRDSQSPETIFGEAINITSARERDAYLDRACENDSNLRVMLEQLVGDHFRAGKFLEQPVAQLAATIGTTGNASMAEKPGALIGPYKLLQQIGEGGMGTVYMAEQIQPVQRKVAIKVIKAGMDSRQVIARFEAERQALAMMDHVNIARVLDAGTTDAGRPYFVMELVHGVPITTYCDDNQLTPKQRLELFVPVCQAIQHAHQKGIIHRDIKPSNVMITLYDGRPVPKVIDFGIAKAIEQKLTERTLFTQYGAIVGTLEYTSPEQAELSALGVDTRSDIYSLGVLLYELLTGSTPLPRKRVREAPYGEIVRMIKEEEPARPSTRLSDSEETLASISAQRRMEPARLTRLLRGDLDWIVMKALEKDRNRRYETASGLAADVQRYLNDEPVQACPPSALYRLRKLARRNKWEFVGASATALVLVLAMVGLSVSNILITRETAEKERALKDKDAALRAARASEKEARKNESIARGAQQEAHENLSDARAAVDQMLSRVADRLVAVPQMEDVRRELLEEAVKFYQKFLEKEGDDPVIRRETAWAYRSLANLQFRFGERTEAEQSFRKAFALFDELGAQSPLEPSARASLVTAHGQFAQLLFELGKPAEHDEHLHRAARIAEDLVQEFPGEMLYRNLLVGANANLIPRMRLAPDQEEEMLHRNLKLTDSPYLLGFIYLHLGHLGVSRGRYPEAEKDYRKCLEKFEIVTSWYPSSNSAQRDLSIALVHLADVMTADRRGGEAEAVYRRAMANLDKLAADYPRYHLYRREQAETQYKYASLLKSLDRAADAEHAYRRAAELSAKLAAEFPTVPTDD